MVYGIQQRLGSLIDHYTVLCLTLALVILSLIGVGDVRVAGMAGIFLCLAGITRGDARVDLRISQKTIDILIEGKSGLASTFRRRTGADEKERIT